MNKKLSLFLACCIAGGFAAACNEATEWSYDGIGCTTDGEQLCDGNIVKVCKDGSYVVEKTCAADEICVQDKVRHTAVCQSGSSACTASCVDGVLTLCNADGTAAAPVKCADSNKVCGTDASGAPACVDGTPVVEDECDTLDATRCNADSTAVEKCVADGERKVWAATACTEGACVVEDDVAQCKADDGKCAEGATKCDGEKLVTCGPDGVYGETDGCAENQVCRTNTEDNTAACENLTCTVGGATYQAGEGVCSEDKTKLATCVVEMDENGAKTASMKEKDCSGGTMGICEPATEDSPATCRPFKDCDGFIHDRKKCDEGSVKICDDGEWKVEEECRDGKVCDAATLTCITSENVCSFEVTGGSPVVVKQPGEACVNNVHYVCPETGEQSSTACMVGDESLKDIAMPSCDGNVCGFTCNDGYQKTEDGTSCECAYDTQCRVNESGVAESRVCMFERLSTWDPCSEMYGSDKNASAFGCSEDGLSCVPTACNDGYTLKDGKCEVATIDPGPDPDYELIKDLRADYATLVTESEGECSMADVANDKIYELEGVVTAASYYTKGSKRIRSFYLQGNALWDDAAILVYCKKDCTLPAGVTVDNIIGKTLKVTGQGISQYNCEMELMNTDTTSVVIEESVSPFDVSPKELELSKLLENGGANIYSGMLVKVNGVKSIEAGATTTKLTQGETSASASTGTSYWSDASTYNWEAANYNVVGIASYNKGLLLAPRTTADISKIECLADADCSDGKTCDTTTNTCVVKIDPTVCTQGKCESDLYYACTEGKYATEGIAKPADLTGGSFACTTDGWVLNCNEGYKPNATNDGCDPVETPVAECTKDEDCTQPAHGIAYCKSNQCVNECVDSGYYLVDGTTCVTCGNSDGVATWDAGECVIKTCDTTKGYAETPVGNECKPADCKDNEVKCENDTSYKLCNYGVWSDVQNVEAGAKCDTATNEIVCKVETGNYACDGNVSTFCENTGTAPFKAVVISDDCSAKTNGATECSAETGECAVPKALQCGTLNAGKCEGNVAYICTQKSEKDPLYWEKSEECAASQTCKEGEGTSGAYCEGAATVCEAGKTQCGSDNKAVQTCKADGSAWEDTACTETQECKVDGGTATCADKTPAGTAIEIDFTKTCEPSYLKCTSTKLGANSYTIQTTYELAGGVKVVVIGQPITTSTDSGGKGTTLTVNKSDPSSSIIVTGLNGINEVTFNYIGWSNKAPNEASVSDGTTTETIDVTKDKKGQFKKAFNNATATTLTIKPEGTTRDNGTSRFVISNLSIK